MLFVQSSLVFNKKGALSNFVPAASDHTLLLLTVHCGNDIPAHSVSHVSSIFPYPPPPLLSFSLSHINTHSGRLLMRELFFGRESDRLVKYSAVTSHCRVSQRHHCGAVEFWYPTRPCCVTESKQICCLRVYLQKNSKANKSTVKVTFWLILKN